MKMSIMFMIYSDKVSCFEHVIWLANPTTSFNPHIDNFRNYFVHLVSWEFSHFTNRWHAWLGCFSSCSGLIAVRVRDKSNYWKPNVRAEPVVLLLHELRYPYIIHANIWYYSLIGWHQRPNYPLSNWCYIKPSWPKYGVQPLYNQTCMEQKPGCSNH